MERWALTKFEKDAVVHFPLETYHDAVMNPMGVQWLRSQSSPALALISDSSRRHSANINYGS